MVLAVVKQDLSETCVCLFSGQRIRIRKRGSEWVSGCTGRGNVFGPSCLGLVIGAQVSETAWRVICEEAIWGRQAGCPQTHFLSVFAIGPKRGLLLGR